MVITPSKMETAMSKGFELQCQTRCTMAEHSWQNSSLLKI